MARILGQELEGFFDEHSRMSAAVRFTDGYTSAGKELPADYVLPVKFEGPGAQKGEGHLSITRLKQGLYLVSVFLGSGLYRSEIVKVYSQRDGSENFGSYTHHLWVHLMYQLRKSGEGQTAA
jgi:hypothetical protein